MNDFWAEELTEEETESLLDKAAEEISRRKMEVPAILFLEMHKPLAYVGSQAAAFFAPFLIPILGFDRVNNYSRLMAKRDNVEKLIQRLEANRDRPREEIHT
jgi:acyl-CoA reductase-like NAD-dependent aldehyde dehydrogenase